MKKLQTPSRSSRIDVEHTVILLKTRLEFLVLFRITQGITDEVDLLDLVSHGGVRVAENPFSFEGKKIIGMRGKPRVHATVYAVLVLWIDELERRKVMRHDDHRVVLLESSELGRQIMARVFVRFCDILLVNIIFVVHGAIRIG